MRAHRLALPLLVLLVLAPVTAPAETRSYRFRLNTPSGDSQYAGPIDPTTSRGPRFDVETDDRGRRLRVTSHVDGAKTSDTVYRFTGDSLLPSGYDVYGATGEHTAIVDAQRNASGQITRLDYFTAARTLAEYSKRAFGGDTVEVTTFSAEGKKGHSYVYHYGPAGTAVRSEWFPASSKQVRYDTEIDPATGLSLGRKKFVQGQVESSTRYTYDPDSNLTLTRVFDPNDRQYGSSTYERGLIMVKAYTFRSGATQETRFTYNASRRATDAAFFRNGKLVCTFVYERLPNGRVTRTRALGPKGELYAEYPDLLVDGVDQRGRPTDQPTAGTIHKRGDWWTDDAQSTGRATHRSRAHSMRAVRLG